MKQNPKYVFEDAQDLRLMRVALNAADTIGNYSKLLLA